MQTVTAYRCEICGFISPDQLEVARCEQGPQPKFKTEDTVSFWSPYFDGDYDLYMNGTITDIRITERSHRVQYKIMAGFPLPGNPLHLLLIDESAIFRILQAQVTA